MGFKISSFAVSLPFGIGQVSVVRTEAQRKAAWALYVEYATRISMQPLEPGTGSLREALSSLHSLFGTTRSVLKELGPGVAEGPDSVGLLAIRILNEGVRPTLVDWHTKLGAFEVAQKRAQQVESPGSEYVIDESQFEELDACYADLDQLRKDLLTYVELLASLIELQDDPSVEGS